VPLKRSAPRHRHTTIAWTQALQLFAEPTELSFRTQHWRAPVRTRVGEEISREAWACRLLEAE
jgi:hypothetical protein